MKIAILILVIAFALYILIPGLSWAEDGRAVHGARRSSHFLLAGQNTTTAAGSAEGRTENRPEEKQDAFSLTVPLLIPNVNR